MPDEYVTCKYSCRVSDGFFSIVDIVRISAPFFASQASPGTERNIVNKINICRLPPVFFLKTRLLCIFHIFT